VKKGVENFLAWKKLPASIEKNAFRGKLESPHHKVEWGSSVMLMSHMLVKTNRWWGSLPCSLCDSFHSLWTSFKFFVCKVTSFSLTKKNTNYCFHHICLVSTNLVLFFINICYFTNAAAAICCDHFLGCLCRKLWIICMCVYFLDLIGRKLGWGSQILRQLLRLWWMLLSSWTRIGMDMLARVRWCMLLMRLLQVNVHQDG